MLPGRRILHDKEEKDLLFAVNIGNSFITIGGFEREELRFEASIEANVRRTAEQYAVDIKQVLELFGAKDASAEGAIVSSVVPELTETVKRALGMLLNVEVMTVGPGIKTGLNIMIDDPAQLGADIAAAACGALAEFASPLIICELGTATAISVIDEKRVLRGVIIAAGMGTTLSSFTDGTALLPHICIERPESVIGKNSKSSMQSGLVYGTAAMIDGLADRIEEEIGARATVIATGESAKTVAAACRRAVTVRERLLLDGLRCIYYRNKTERK